MHKVSIIGAGFGGLTAVRQIRRQLPDAEITLIAPKAEFIYYPSLIWIPTGLRKGEQLRIPLDRFFQRKNVHFHAGRVTELRDEGRTVVTDQGEIVNDVLIIASGGRGLRKLPGIEHSLAICDGIEAAEQIRDRLAALDKGTIAFGFAGNPQEPTAVRGGPVFELLFGIDSYLRKIGRREQIDLVFFNPMTEPGNRLGAKAVAGLLAEMEKRQIKTHLGHKITGFSADKVMTEGGEIAANLILFMPGMTGTDWAQQSGLPLSPGGFIQADEYCQVPGHPGVFVVGDAGSYANSPDWLPKQGHTADLQAEAAVHNAVLHLQNKASDKPFRAELVCIVDALDSGIMVFRNKDHASVLPNPLWHAAKMAFEWRYLLHYR
ncbi:pyridine nucleotide-disulfide oxidoreductase [Acidithiobacillus thiooxidans]|uniref:Pyridine nucleotide-disulfide oxidoreductase n=1 Tax=Acidithiobacillus thiooxidans TaxID=930 RepID=A0A1C2IN05_ACITH|nr:FAD-dependent oxidoreductase [Acidithiobacillus thiooxidans]OCX71748.1 pyridine nucleotide-disulfide oxidoreductase [Acidithiobacillus thiooxidans]OCX75276.1 pyridine nucleotide-disulfide oxidoreductase [Acidithiobacillus thiooxidans]OCX77426.1 pyridine nucleotide-disulfide oxidoreductase [Acidithiobacillus thiooxidans]OCX82551.1 pyridine nucleotide-disulfide oxidoreductase [Acidithiobacillus thiooxidans]OCX87267.1 pyridine nucleotide-disulfide oxidoreductase [Acidithiobacillus thiooxidans]